MTRLKELQTAIKHLELDKNNLLKKYRIDAGKKIAIKTKLFLKKQQVLSKGLMW